MATYNGERFIEEQLASIIPQLSDGDEIIISDDHSTDRTVERIRSLACPLITVHAHKERLGYTANFERALEQAGGDIIFLADQDDVWAKHKVEHCLRMLKDADLAVTDAAIIGEDNRPLAPSYYTERRVRQGFMGNLVKFGFLGCCMCFRREVLRLALPFPRNRRYCTHDNWIFLVATAYFRVKVSDKKLLFYRRHNRNASEGEKNAKRSTLFRIAYRLYLINGLLQRMRKRKSDSHL